mgnify:CR=1 FL=1
MRRVLIIIIAYNEDKTVGNVINGLQEVSSELDCETEILLVDDCSTDETPSIARNAGVNVVTHPTNMGPGAAAQTGFKFAVRNSFDAVVAMDADGQHRPQDVPELLDSLNKKDVDIVVGSRFLGNFNYEMGVVRYSGIKFYSRLITLITGEEITDLTSGFRAMTIDVAENYAKRYPKGIVAIDRGLREGLGAFTYREVPVQMNGRENGNSFLNIRQLAKYPFRSAHTFFRVILRM